MEFNLRKEEYLLIKDSIRAEKKKSFFAKLQSKKYQKPTETEGIFVKTEE